MEDVVTEKVCLAPPLLLETSETHDVKSTESAENFQKFMYELFEKNGVINDLRAYLRGHIVGILRSTRTGDPPACQKNFTQRLELPYQALNMLIAEYLLRLEFSYTLSVFVSEIPLGNMVLDYARSLMQDNKDNTELRFKDEDVWSILNYLDIKCDSEHAASIVEMYRDETQPLLLCMMKCMPLYTHIGLEKESSQASTSSVKSDKVDQKSHARCTHLAFCKTCHDKMAKIKDRYREKKKTITKDLKETVEKTRNVESLMKNIDVIERNLIDEMFQQLKSVYEAEIQMAKTEEEERVKRSLASHAVQLQKRQHEMEERYKARECELSRGVQQKRRFLWGLARLLREQRRRLARAMRNVQAETDRLSAKENSLKSQLAEAESVLRSRGEEMRQQISAELVTLEGHLQSMQRERDNIHKERSELEHLKHLCDNAKRTNIDANDDLRSHYDLLKNEFSVLKKYLESTKFEPKRVIERSTTTVEDDSTKFDAVLNNGQGFERSRSEDRLKTKQVVNDLKKLKNVNFSQSNLAEIYCERSRSSPSHSTVSSDGDTRDATRHDTRDATRHDTRDVTRDDTRDGMDHGTRDAMRRDAHDITQRLLDENERLRTFARQQRTHIDELSSQQARLNAELTAARFSAPRPRTAPPPAPAPVHLHRLCASASSQRLAGGWRQGAGEEACMFPAPPRVLRPGDTLPFVGVLRDRHTDNRRYLINQWRSLRRRASPSAGGRARPATAPHRERANSAGPSARLPPEEGLDAQEQQRHVFEPSYKIPPDQYESRSKCSEKSARVRERSPKSSLRETKDKLKSSRERSPTSARGHSPSYGRERSPSHGRERSPGGVVRAAKLRLRKLELEAEAVEMSYLHFRREQDAKRANNTATTAQHDLGLKNERAPSLKPDQTHVESTSRYVPPHNIEQIIEDIDEYQAKYDISATHFKNKTTTSTKVRPIPPTSPFHTQLNRHQNYLDTSMTEFRKYYHSDKRPKELIEDPRSTRHLHSPDFNKPPRSPFISPLIPEERPSTARNRKNSLENDHLRSRNESLEIHEPPTDPIKNRDSSNSESLNQIRSPKKDKSPRTETFRPKHDKAKELEILKQNISKMYNLTENTVTTNENCNEAVENAKWEMENERKAIIETIIEASRDETCSDLASKDPEDKNLLRIEVQSVSQVNDVKLTESQTQDLLLVVASSKVAEHSEMHFPEDVLSTQMTILVSPKRSISIKSNEISIKAGNSHGEKSVKLSADDVLNSLYRAEANEHISSVHMQLDASKDVLVPFLSEVEIIEDPDYPDDFSADADNFNSRYDTDQEHSPISMAKTSEDENFWDS